MTYEYPAEVVRAKARERRALVEVARAAAALTESADAGVSSLTVDPVAWESTVEALDRLRELSDGMVVE